VIEAGWLLALVFTPYYFSLLTARHFEPDKAMALRSIVLIMLAAWAIKTIERVTVLRETIDWRAWYRAPLAVPALLFGAVFVAATLTSIRPETSWWGSYQRGQGTYTNLSYIALFALLVGNLRRREQLDRLVSAVVLTATSVAVYGVVQHLGLDPLPWKGDVITRVSSTMGNSIFVAAYLTMALPFVLYRLAMSLRALPTAPTGERAVDGAWIGFFVLLLLGQQALLLGIFKFMGAVRPLTGDFRYWWVFPAGLLIVAASFALVGERTTLRPPRRLLGWSLGALGAWALALLLLTLASSSEQSIDTADPVLRDWWVWLLLGVAGIAGFGAAALRLPRRAVAATRLLMAAQVAGYAGALVLILAAIFFSQSRGPWIGGMAGIGVFVLLLLGRLIAAAREHSHPALGRLRAAFWGVLGVGALLAALLVVFNVSDAPVFERLRQAPYIGRLGRLLETDDGTGRVRVLIWFGDSRGGGTVGLLRSNWLRTLTLGHGPETMFTAFNPHYPPELAYYEQRGASPDRSHQAWLDELVTKGALGLVSYFWLFGAAAMLALRQIYRSRDWNTQVLSIAALSAIVAHFVEVLVGIPIVSTLTMLWATLGVLVVAGKLQGGEEIVAAVPQPVEAQSEQLALAIGTPALAGSGNVALAAPTTRGGKPRAQAPSGRPARGGRGRGARAGATGRDVALHSGSSPYRWAYPVLIVATLALVWTANLRNSYADMFLNQANSFTPRNLNEEAFAYQKLLRAVQTDPREDYYYLQLGNALLRMVYPYKLSAQQDFGESSAPRPDQQLADLFADRGGEIERVEWLLRDNSAEQMLRYTQLVLEQAWRLNPTNKDHPANLGRLMSLWARRAGGGAPKLQEAAEWFETARRIAPNDANLANELATVQALQGNVEQAEASFRESLALDPRYAETYARLGELYLGAGRTGEAAEQFAAAVERNRSILESDVRGLDPILAPLKRDQAALDMLRSAFEQQYRQLEQAQQEARAAGREPAVDARFLSQLGRVRAAAGDADGTSAAFEQVLAAAPDNVGYLQQYTVALSDTLQYDAALERGEQALALAQQSGDERRAGEIQAIIAAIRQNADN